MKTEMLFEYCPFLAGKTVTVSRASVFDTDGLFALMHDESLCRFEPEPAAVQAADAERRLREAERLFRDKKAVLFSVCGHEDLGKMIGWVQIDGLDPKLDRARLRCVFTRESAASGLAAAALRTVAQYLVEKVGVNRLEAMTRAEDEAKQELLLSAGFQKEGVLRESRPWGNLPRADIAILALLARDLPAEEPEDEAVAEETPEAPQKDGLLSDIPDFEEPESRFPIL